MPICLPEHLKPVVLLSNRVGAGAVTSTYASLKNANKAWLVVNFTEGGAEAITLTPMKATAVAPANALAITSTMRIWSNLATAVNDTMVERTAALTYATGAAAASKIVIFEVDPAALGTMADGTPYDCIGLDCGAPNALDYICVTLWIEPKYASAVANQPTVLTD